MKWTPRDCLPGDMIRIRTGSIYHYGIYVSDDEVIEFGEPPVNGLIRDFDAIRVIAASIDEFASGSIVEVAGCETRAEKKQRLSPADTIENARKRLGEGGYDLLHNNCEHFAYLCATGTPVCTASENARERWKRVFAGKEASINTHESIKEDLK